MSVRKIKPGRAYTDAELVQICARHAYPLDQIQRCAAFGKQIGLEDLDEFLRRCQATGVSPGTAMAEMTREIVKVAAQEHDASDRARIARVNWWVRVVVGSASIVFALGFFAEDGLDTFLLGTIFFWAGLFQIGKRNGARR